MYAAWRRLFPRISTVDGKKLATMNLSLILKSLLEDTQIASCTIDALSAEDVNELLRADDTIIDEQPRQSIKGYPTRPLYREIGNTLQAWASTGHCPVLDLPSYHLLDEKSYVEQRSKTIDQISSVLEGTKGLWENWNDEERKQKLKEIINMLGKRGLLDLLGIRKTVGTVDVWPPPRKVLQDTFNTLNKPKTASTLTVGARALTKHCHRDETMTWWGNVTGSEAQKNEHAIGIVNKILDNAQWINIHTLPHDIYVIEVRHEHGYGVRWTADGKQFRGFLEPQMEDGHEVGWRH